MSSFIKATIAVLAVAIASPTSAMGRSPTKSRDPVQRVPPPGSAPHKPGPGATATEPESPTGDVRTRSTSESGTDAKTATTGPDAGRAPIGNNTGAHDPGNAGATGGTFGTAQ